MSNVAEINAELIRLSTALATTVIEYDAAVKDTATKQSDYEVAKAKVEFETEGTETQRKAKAVIETESQLRAYREAKAIERALAARMETLQARLNGVQTRASNEREEMKLAGKLD